MLSLKKNCLVAEKVEIFFWSNTDGKKFERIGIRARFHVYLLFDSLFTECFSGPI